MISNVVHHFDSVAPYDRFWDEPVVARSLGEVSVSAPLATRVDYFLMGLRKP
jgi:hypothetical protein